MECLQATHIAENTLRAYRSGWRIWTRWTAERGIVAFPSDYDDVCRFLEDRASNHKIGTVDQNLKALRYVNLEERGIDLLDKTQAEGRAVQRKIRSLKRRHAGTPQRQAKPLTLPLLDRMEQSFDVDRKHWALCEVLFGGAFRVSEAATMEVQHVERLDNGGGRIWVPKSKTDPEGNGVWQKIPQRTMLALRDMLDFPEGTPLFQTRKRRHATDPNTLTRWVQQAIRDIGEDSKGFGGHSGRVGFALYLEARGLRPTQIARLGRWRRVETVERYLRGFNDEDDFFAAFG